MRAVERFERALRASAQRAGTPITIASHAASEWRSATFNGVRHVLEASGAGSVALDSWLAALEDTNLAIPGHMVAELKVGACDRAGTTARFRLEGVTVALA